MILKNAKTVWVNDDPWESPDGKVTIWQIKLEVDGERDTHNTMSKALATMGFEGDVEVYTNAKGKDYVRQAPKEEAPKEDGHPSGETSFKADPVKQDNIHRSVALEQAINFGATAKLDVEATLNIATRFYTWLKDETPSTDSEKSPKGKVDKVFDDGEPLPEYTED